MFQIKDIPNHSAVEMISFFRSETERIPQKKADQGTWFKVEVTECVEREKARKVGASGARENRVDGYGWMEWMGGKNGCVFEQYD